MTLTTEEVLATAEELQRAANLATDLLARLSTAVDRDCGAGMFVLSMMAKVMHAATNEEGRDEVELIARELVVSLYEQRADLKGQEAKKGPDGKVAVRFSVGIKADRS